MATKHFDENTSSRPKPPNSNGNGILSNPLQSGGTKPSFGE